MAKKLYFSLITAFLFFAVPATVQLLAAQQLPNFIKIASQATPIFVDATCPNGATCTYYITSINPAGESAPSNQVSGAVPATGVHTITINGTVTPGAKSYNLYQSIIPLPATITSIVVN
jgi:hypothetical protein